MAINFLRNRLADAADGLQVGEPGARHIAGRAKMQQQRLLALRANPLNLIERRGRDLARPFRAMGGDRESVRLVA